MNTSIIVQARMASSRLPGKVLLEVEGKPLLEYQIERLQRVRNADFVVIATTTNSLDDTIHDFCQRLNIRCHRGPEADVLERYCQAAESYGIDVVVRVTADCPLIDPDIIDQIVRYYLDHREEYDYVSNTLKRTYPRGMDCEVFSADLLRQVNRKATEQYEREHVTPYVYEHPNQYRLGAVTDSKNMSHHRWTVDTVEDFQLISRMLKALMPISHQFTLSDCLNLLARHPDWIALNSAVEQREVRP